MADLKLQNDDSSDSDDEEVILILRLLPLYSKDTYDVSLQSNEFYEMRMTKKALNEIWRLIKLNPENNKAWMDDPDVKKKDIWVCFLNHFFYASLNRCDIEIEDNMDLLLEHEEKIGLKSSNRTGKDGWFNRLCFGDKDYQPFLSSRDTFAERFQALMFDLVDLDCQPKMDYAALESRPFF
jgi:hypothetical protein